MKKAKNTDSYFFVDESGDPTFFDKRGNLIVGHQGCSSYFILGFIETQSPQLLRASLKEMRYEIADNEDFAKIASLEKTLRAFHAKDDHSKIRSFLFKRIAQLDFRTEFIIIRKVGLEEEFRRRYKGDGNHLYDQIVSMLFESVLHRFQNNHIYFSARGSRPRHAPLQKAIDYAVNQFQQKSGSQAQCKVTVQAQQPSDEPCLSIIDYMT